MTDCPVCKSRMFIVKYRWFTNIIGLTTPHFICDNCGYRINVKDLRKAGGIDNIGKNVSQGWEKIEMLPDWAFRRMKRKRKNKVNGKNYTYKKEGNNFYRKLR